MGGPCRKVEFLKIYIRSENARIILSIRNKTQKEAAQTAGITPEHFSRLMTGECQPSADTRKKLTSKVFTGVAWDRLFKIVDNTGGSL